MVESVSVVTSRQAIDAGIDRWNDTHERFAISDPLREQNVYAPFERLSVRAYALGGDPDRGFAILKRPVEPIAEYADESVAWLALLVAPDRASTTSVLDALAETLVADGVERLHFGGDPQHFFPGLPRELTGSLRDGLLDADFETGGPVVDLTRRLTDYETPPGVGETQAEWAAELRRATDRRADLLSLLAGTFSARWRYEAANIARLPGGLASYWLLYDVDTPVGFVRTSTPDSTFKAPNRTLAHRFEESVLGVGPLGIVPDYRGRGWGLAMIDTVLRHYRDRGLERAIIDWTDIPGYYERLGFETCCTYEPVRRSLV